MIDRRHNGGPSLDEDRPASPVSAACKWCRHWTAPPEQVERDYEAFRLGLSRRRVKRPSGACDRILYSIGKPVAFGATNAEFSCLNFDQRPQDPRPKGGGWVTIWQDDRIVWQGREEDAPADQLSLFV